MRGLEDNFDGIRQQALSQSQLGPVEYGAPPEIVVATGRAKCRQCGQKIGKGEQAVRFAWDYAGCGSWTCVTSYIHLSDCDHLAAPRRLAREEGGNQRD